MASSAPDFAQWHAFLSACEAYLAAQDHLNDIAPEDGIVAFDLYKLRQLAVHARKLTGVVEPVFDRFEDKMHRLVKKATELGEATSPLDSQFITKFESFVLIMSLMAQRLPDIIDFLGTAYPVLDLPDGTEVKKHAADIKADLENTVGADKAVIEEFTDIATRQLSEILLRNSAMRQEPGSLKALSRTSHFETVVQEVSQESGLPEELVRLAVMDFMRNNGESKPL